MSEITYDDFVKVDMRVGRILEVKEFPRARNPSYKIHVDLGPLGTRWSSAQVTTYEMDDLVGQQVICVVNFPPRNIAGFMSEVLIMGAEDGKGDVILLQPEQNIPLGQRIY